jgi:hypothetical protein
MLRRAKAWACGMAVFGLVCFVSVECALNRVGVPGGFNHTEEALMAAGLVTVVVGGTLAVLAGFVAWFMDE